MPLPPAPTKPADRLTPKAFETSARATRRPLPKGDAALVASTVAEVPAVQKRKTSPVARSKLKEVPASPMVSVPTAVTTTAQAQAAPIAHHSIRAKKAPHAGPTKLFVLDTNVLLHDPMCLFRFEEHDIYLPMIVLEELDGHKKGMTEVARNARQTSRTLDALAGTPGADISAGFQLNSTGHREAGGKLLFQTQPLNYSLPTSLPQGKADNQILGVVEALRQLHAPREVVLVSKHINMRVKSRALGLLPTTTRMTKPWKTAIYFTRGPLHCHRTFGPPMARRWKAGNKASTPSTRWTVRWCRVC